MFKIRAYNNNFQSIWLEKYFSFTFTHKSLYWVQIRKYASQYISFLFLKKKRRNTNIQRGAKERKTFSSGTFEQIYDKYFQKFVKLIRKRFSTFIWLSFYFAHKWSSYFCLIMKYSKLRLLTNIIHFSDYTIYRKEFSIKF